MEERSKFTTKSSRFQQKNECKRVSGLRDCGEQNFQELDFEIQNETGNVGIETFMYTRVEAKRRGQNCCPISKRIGFESNHLL